jgi:hypothetical protein
MADHTQADLTGFLYALVGYSPPQTVSKQLVGDLTLIRDVQYGGIGRVNGNVYIDGTPDIPVSRRVRLINERDGLPIRETWSDAATGAYSFDKVAMGVRYTVIAYDYENNYRAIVADNVLAESML